LLTCSMLLVSSLKLNYLENICMGPLVVVYVYVGTVVFLYDYEGAPCVLTGHARNSKNQYLTL